MHSTLCHRSACPSWRCSNREFDRLASVGGFEGDDVNAAALAIEHDLAFNQSKQCVIVALADILTRMKSGADLADQDVTGTDDFTAETLDTTSLAIRIATVPGGALSFFMCHFAKSFAQIPRQTVPTLWLTASHPAH